MISKNYLQHRKDVLDVFPIIFLTFTVNGAQREKEDDIKEKAYCYRFSWLGPKYNNDTDFGTGTNLTCSDVVSNTEVNPCRQPLVVTCR